MKESTMVAKKYGIYEYNKKYSKIRTAVTKWVKDNYPDIYEEIKNKIEKENEKDNT